MKITISSHEIGSDKNLAYDGILWSWVDNPDPDSILWGFDDPRDVREAVTCLNRLPTRISKTKWGIAQGKVQGDLSDIPWRYCIPESSWRGFVKNLVEHLWLIFSDESNSYYVNTHLRNRAVIWKLQQPLIDTLRIESIAKSSSNGLRQNLEKFLPKTGEISPKSKYSLSGAVTGRMTISEGPNILTLSKKHRNIIRSRYENGKIIEIDLQSAEPRVALSLFGKSIDGDVYEDVMKSIDVNITRDVAKVATISAIYGASHHGLRSILPDTVNSGRVLEEVREYFGVRFLMKMIEDQHKSAGYIVNTHGRKIFSCEPSVNHLVQSSSVDVSFDIFEELLNTLSENNIQFSPLYLIHDAIILDINSEHEDVIRKLCRNGFKSHTTQTIFPVKIKEIN